MAEAAGRVECEMLDVTERVRHLLAASERIDRKLLDMRASADRFVTRLGSLAG